MIWLFLSAWIVLLLWLLAEKRLDRQQWSIILGISMVLMLFWDAVPGWFALIAVLYMAAVLMLMHAHQLRKNWLTEPLLRKMKTMLPPLSQTEIEAMEAGTVWWDAELFSGDPDWQKLLSVKKNVLSDEEQAFLDGPVDTLCAMLDDWEITHKLNDLPENVWAYMRQEKFFGMIIEKEFGGLGFSAYAHSEVIQRISSRSLTAAVTVMVPNSLGPAELLQSYGTDKQKQWYLPRLATGEALPCFALTGPEAGSDAGAMPDRGVVCQQQWNGNMTLGFRVNWNKRYITLSPVASVLGLAFHAYDPDALLGKEVDLGITCALIPTDATGVKVGRRHYPLNSAFMNGPTQGKDVFVPMEWIIGGQERVGQGWKMLVERLAVGRGISLPSLSVGAGKLASRSCGAYARVRKQFRLPIGRFEGVQEAMASVGGMTYLMDSARRLTLAALDAGERPSVVTAIVKYYLTEGMRKVINDAMDIHGGRGICMGPTNYLARAYQTVPVGITVEGANILTRNMIIFGQGATRCHPYVLKEMAILHRDMDEQTIEQFDAVMQQHVLHTVGNGCRAFLYGATGGHLAAAPVSGEVGKYYRQLSRFSSGFAFAADLALLTLGGALKRKESISARFADALGYMYLCSAVLKRFQDDGRPRDDLPMVQWACEFALFQIQEAFDGIIRHFPNRLFRLKLRLCLLPWGRTLHRPADALNASVAEIMMKPGASRDRLTEGVYCPASRDDLLGGLDAALASTLKAEPVERRLRDGGDVYLPGDDYQLWLTELRQAGKLSQADIELMQTAREDLLRIIQVDDFPAGRKRAVKPV